MKETIKINLNGQLFDLDNDAYNRLKAYLSAIETRFSASADEAKEILEDIEARIAEILREKITPSKQVISLQDIEEIIQVMGTAEDIDQSEENSGETNTENNRTTVKNKRFYRDPQNRVFGGVCAGLAAYFNVDVIWIRLLFVFLFFANLAGLIIYIILWVVMPPALNMAQRLEMQGKRVTLCDIEESVKQEYDKVKSSVKNIPHSSSYRSVKSAFSEIFQVLGTIVLTALKIIVATIAILVLLSLVLGILALALGGISVFPLYLIPELPWLQFPEASDPVLIAILLLFVILLPIIALASGVFRWLLGLQPVNRILAGITAAIWTLAFIGLVFLLVAESERGSFRQKSQSAYTFEPGIEKILYLKHLGNASDSTKLDHYQVFSYRFSIDDTHDRIWMKPRLEIKSSADSLIHLQVTRSYADFRIGKIPDSSFEMIDYGWKKEKNELSLEKYFGCTEEDAWRFPSLSLELLVPEGHTVVFEPAVAAMLSDTIRSNQPYQIQAGGSITTANDK